jgi:hypothetical protein
MEDLIMLSVKLHAANRAAEFIAVLSQVMMMYDDLNPDEKIAAARWFNSIWFPE